MRLLIRLVLLRRAGSVSPPPVYTPKLDFSDPRNSQYFIMGWP